MNKRTLIILFNVVMIAIFLANYNNRNVITNPNTDIPAEEQVNINMTIEKDIDDSMLQEAEEAFSYLPMEIVEAFSERGWKLVVVSSIDLSGTQYENCSDEENELVVGLTNFKTKTIQVKAVKRYNGFLCVKTLHELCHFADEYYGTPSNSEEFKELYKKYKNIYREYEYYNVKKTMENAIDIDYVTSDESEFFASVMKDYFMHKEYLSSTSPDLYDYIQKIVS